MQNMYIECKANIETCWTLNSPCMLRSLYTVTKCIDGLDFISIWKVILAMLETTQQSRQF